MTLLSVSLSRKEVSHVTGDFLASGGRRSPLLPGIGNWGDGGGGWHGLRSLCKQPFSSLLYYPTQTLFRFFTKWVPKDKVSLSGQFLTNWLFLCLKSTHTASFDHFLGPISKRAPCELKCVAFSSVNLSCANFIIRPCTSTQEGWRGKLPLPDSYHKI